MPTDDPPETFHVSTEEQLRAVSNLTRHRIMAVLRFEPATITQIAAQVGLAKGSSSYHVRLLERAGLVKVVRTRKVRGSHRALLRDGRAARSSCPIQRRDSRTC